MSDLEIILEEISILREHIGSMIYRAKATGNIMALQEICAVLSLAVDEMPDLPAINPNRE
jgi:hypothetical protein